MDEIEQLKEQLERHKALLAALAAILEKRIALTADFIAELRMAAEQVPSLPNPAAQDTIDRSGPYANPID